MNLIITEALLNLVLATFASTFYFISSFVKSNSRSRYFALSVRLTKPRHFCLSRSCCSWTECVFNSQHWRLFLQNWTRFWEFSGDEHGGVCRISKWVGL